MPRSKEADLARQAFNKGLAGIVPPITALANGQTALARMKRERCGSLFFWQLRAALRLPVRPTRLLRQLLLVLHLQPMPPLQLGLIDFPTAELKRGG